MKAKKLAGVVALSLLALVFWCGRRCSKGAYPLCDAYGPNRTGSLAGCT